MNQLTANQISLTRAAMAQHINPDGSYNSTRIAADLGIARSSAQHRIGVVLSDGNPEGSDVPHEMVREAWIDGPTIELVSRKDNTFVFGAFGDLHAASKYCRWDVREDLVRRAERRGCQAIFDTGNWIEGDARFNQFDVEERGMERQLQLLATKHPKTNLEIYAVTGDDHEGWYAQREGVNIGRYCQQVMRQAGHKWTDLGYMESHVRLKNANTGKSQIMAVNHPGGGSAYALSYRPQKIVECVPLHSEILTREGWKRHNQVIAGDEVLGYNSETDQCEWTTIKSVHNGRGQVVRYSNDQFSAECTPNHRWAIEWESRAGPNHASLDPQPYSRRDRLIGTIDENRDRSRIIQAAPAPDGPGLEQFDHEDWLHRSERATLRVLQMTSGERRAFIEGLMLGEGTVGGRPGDGFRTLVFSQRPGPVNDAFRLACFLEGIATTDKPAPAGSFKPDGDPTRRVTMLKKRMRICNRLKQEDLGEQSVWCVSTGLGTWVMRQGSTITITGNSLEGGEKPAVMLIGHYHKLEVVIVRNVWVLQTGCQQDQSPFMRKKGIDAHVGGIIVTLEQDPKTGAIIGCTPEILRYFNKDYYSVSGRWSHHGPVSQPSRRR